MRKVYYFTKEGKIAVKNVIDNYILLSGETFEDLRKYVKPEILPTGDVIETATPEEMELYLNEMQKENMRKFREKTRTDGKEFFNEIDVEATMKLYGKPKNIVVPAVEEIDAYIFPIMELVKNGQWYSALMKLRKTKQPTNIIANEIFEKIRKKIENYVAENY